MRMSILIPLIATCMLVVGCGTREQVYEEAKRPTQTVQNVNVTLITWRQSDESVAYRIKVDNHSGKQVSLFSRPGIPLWDGLQVVVNGKGYASLPAGNELPAEDFSEHFYSTSGMRMLRDLQQVGDKSALVVENGAFKRFDLKANWSTLSNEGDKPITTPWSLKLLITDSTGASLGEVLLNP